MKDAKNPAKIWLLINVLVGNSNKKTLECFKVGAYAVDGHEMVSYANSYFVGIAYNLTNNIQSSGPY